jgi:uncharacterized protein (TIGR03437 family)
MEKSMRSMLIVPFSVGLIIGLALLTPTFGQPSQANNGFAGAGVSIAFQNGGPEVTGQGASIAFQNGAAVTVGQGISIAFSSCPISANTVVPTFAKVNEPVVFLATVTSSQCPGTPFYSWDFNDGTPKSTQANPKHPYSSPGTFTWSLTISFTNSSQLTRTGVITISNTCVPPTLVKPIDGTIIPKGKTAILTVSASSDTPMMYQWYKGASGDKSTPLPNGTGSTYTTESLADDTSYWVEVSNNCGPIWSNTAVVTLAGSGTPQIQMVDPNCDYNLRCNGAYIKKKSDQSDEVVIDNSDYDKLADAHVYRFQIVADGVTMLLLRVRSESRVRFYMAQFPFRGELMTLDGSVKGGDITVDPVATKRGKIAFAVFRAPIDNFAEGVYVNALSESAGASKVWIPFRKPPVVLVHGVWSNGKAWEGLAGKLRKEGFDVCHECLPDYGTKQPAGSFDPLATKEEDQYVIKTLIASIGQALRAMRTQKIAVTQVDIVGHSMGGIVARARVASAFDPYRKPGNYWSGDFHKIITVGSPHRGTILADWLLQHRKDELDLTGKALAKDDNTLGGLLAAKGRPLGPAIFGFQTTSEAIKNIGETRVNAYAIVGIAPPSPLISDTEDNLNWLIKRRINHQNGESIDGIINNEEHDTIVPVSSQQGGLSDKSIKTISGIVHADVEPFDLLTQQDDINETSSADVWDKIIAVLNSPITDGAGTFSYFQALGNALSAPAEVSTYSSPRKVDRTNRQSLQEAIISVNLAPAPGKVVHPGDVVQINFETPADNSIEGAMFVLEKQFTMVKGAGPFSFSTVIPTTKTGRINIEAVTYGSGQDVYYGATYLVIEPRSSLTSLEASPSPLILSKVGEKYQLRVTGHYSTELQADLTSPHSGTTYVVKSGSSKVVTVSADGEVEAKGEGKDEIIITNSGQVVSVPIYVMLITTPAGSEGVTVSAASYNRTSTAADAIVTIFGTGLAKATASAVTQPLPLALAGTSVVVKDSTGTDRPAPLFFVSPTQINFQIPPGTAPGIVSVAVNRAGDIPVSDTFELAIVAPAIFSADANGRGLAAAQVQRVRSDNTQSYEPVCRFDQIQSKFVAVPIDLSPVSDQVFLVLYGTGIRYRSGLANVSVRIGGVDAEVTYAGAQGGFVGLDQVNVRLPRLLAGRGEVDVELTVDGKPANTVKINLK